MNWSERSCYRLLKESDKGDEVHTKHHWPTIDHVNRQAWKHKLVR